MIKEFKAIRILYLVVLSCSLVLLVSPFLIPIFFAGTVALALYPLVLKLESWGLKRRGASFILTTLFTIVISIPLFFFLIKGTMTVTRHLEKMSFQDHGVAEMVTDMRYDIVVFVQKFSSKYEFLSFLNAKKIDEYMVVVNKFLLGFFKDLATGLPTMVIFLLIMILCTYSFLKNGINVRHFFQSLTGFSDDKMSDLTDIFIRNSRQVYMSNIVTGGVQSLIVATGVASLGFADFFLVFFVTLILSFIPVVGASPVAFLFSFLAFLKDNTTASIILLVLGSFTGVVDNFLRPWLASFGESRIPPIVAFVCVIGGALMFGFPGLFIGLLIGSIAYDTLPIFWKELDSKEL
jgi:predicted PurR-regulated permease PerM